MFWLLSHKLSQPWLSERRRQMKAARQAARDEAAKSGKAGKAGKSAAKSAASKTTQPAAHPTPEHPAGGTARETVDGLVFAFVLLILLRAFLLEPFVIPTGSMAPTLYGRHKECQCDGCGHAFQIGASDELFQDNAMLRGDARIDTAICPNCRRPNAVRDALAFNGDHILANKWSYELGEPDRFDIFVFKYPENASKNYIKRLVGLPGETVRIRDGDLFLVDGDGRESIIRKPTARKQRAMMQLVHDNTFHADGLHEAGWPQRWRVDRGEAAGTGFVVDGTGDVGSLTYTHYVPSVADWEIAASGGVLDPQASLIVDFCGYNAFSGVGMQEALRPEQIQQGAFWVTDLAIACDVEIADADGEGELTIELREGVHRYLCTLPIVDGSFADAVTLATVDVSQDATDVRERGTVPVSLGSSHRVRFSQCDDELRVWIDGEPVAIDESIRFLERGPLDLIEPQESDLQPIAIRVAGAKVGVSNLRIERDLYYRTERAEGPESRRTRGTRGLLRDRLAGLVRQPETYAGALAEFRDVVDSQSVTAPDGHYLAFGDNSPRSQDSRLWDEGNQSVPQSYLVGKAFWIYWPHGVPFLNGGRGFAIRHHTKPGVGGRAQKVGDYPLYQVPFYPQVSRMKRIR